MDIKPNKFSSSVTLPATMEHLEEALSPVRNGMEQAGADSKTALNVEIILEEFFTNVASYAYPEAPGDVEISYLITEAPLTVTVRIADHGIPYNPLEHQDPDVNAPLEERTIGGYGIYMAKNMMDDVSYEYRNGQNIVTFRKEI